MMQHHNQGEKIMKKLTLAALLILSCFARDTQAQTNWACPFSPGSMVATYSEMITVSSTALPFTAATWTASGGSIVARWAVLYEVGGNVAAYCLLDATVADVTIDADELLSIVAGNLFSAT
jgi:hypothetical protein